MNKKNSSKSLRNHLKDALPFLLILCVIGGYLVFTATQGDKESGGIAANIGGQFSLINEDEQPVTEAAYRGQYLLIYFGFTFCPAICPTELQKMSEAYEMLSKEAQDKIQPLFITVDPERDTPELLKGYTDMFLPNLVGLTGSLAQIEAVKKAYKVYASKVPENDTYTMDHSSFIYLVSPEGRVVSMFKTADKAADLADRMKAIVK